jgi:hypothetical protein
MFIPHEDKKSEALHFQFFGQQLIPIVQGLFIKDKPASQHR